MTWLCNVLAFVLLSGASFAPDWRAEAETLARDGELDAAVLLVERYLDETPGDAEAWRWLAGTLERLVDDEGRSVMILSEAAAAWNRVRELVPDDEAAALAAARAHLRAGELDAAERGTQEVLELQRRLRGDASSAAAGLLLRVRTASFDLADHAERAGLLRGVRDVRRTAAEARALAPDGVEALLVEVDWLASIHLADVALEKLRVALERQPATVALHRAFVDYHVAFGLEERLTGAYSALAALHPDDAVTRWYEGYAARIVGDLASRERRDPDAQAAYEHCVAALRRSVELDPSFAETALWIEMQARTAAGWSALDAGDAAGAERRWLAVLDEWPEFGQRVDGLGRTPAQGLGRLGGRYLVHDKLDRAERVSRAVAQVTQQPWSWNNVGYLNREIASEIERSGAAGSVDMARSRFQQSYKAYRRATELAPTEPRIVNDTALIQIYHLRDDLEGAEEMLREAIRIGEEQLAALGPDPEETERFPIAYAVGDAWQNLGYLHYRLKNDPITARGYFVRSLQTDTGERRVVRASIQAIDAGRASTFARQGEETPAVQPPEGIDLPEKPDVAAGSGGPAEAAREAAARPEPLLRPEPSEPSEPVEEEIDLAEAAQDVDWERSIDLALEAAEAEGRRVLVYHRVGGRLGPSVEFLQRFLHSESFFRRTAGSLTLLADELRHTFVDRRRDGRAVACPRAGNLRCADHIAVAEEFAARWRALGRGPFRRDSNGLFHVTADDLQRLGRAEDEFERFRPEGDAGAASDTAATTRARFAAASSEELARSRRLAARRELERRIFEPAGADERADAIAALWPVRSAENDELLTALASQHADPALAEQALRSWPAGLGGDVPLYMLQASRDAAVREAAVAALIASGDPVAERALVARWAYLHERPGEASGELEARLQRPLTVIGDEALRDPGALR